MALSVDHPRRCTKCGETKPRTEFYRHSQCPSTTHSECKACSRSSWNAARRRWKQKNPEAAARSTKRKNLRRFGISLEQYEEMAARQGGACAICGATPERALDVDHDHETGAIRALLCGMCNRGLGSFRDRADLMVKAIDYIRSFAVKEIANGP